MTTFQQLFLVICTTATFGASSTAAFAEPPPSAATVDQCVELNRSSQELRRQGQFAEARVKLLSCIHTQCPGLLRDDCTERLDELERAQPTIVFDVRDSAGQDLSKIAVSVDDQLLASYADGRALVVNPGQHSFTFEDKATGAKLTKVFVLHEGEKVRRERIVLASSNTPTPVPGAHPGAVTLPLRDVAKPAWNAWQIGALASLGAGVLGIGTGSAAALFARSKARDADSYCPQAECSDRRAVDMNHDAMRAGNVASVAFAVGAVGLAAAVTCYLIGDPSEGDASAAVAWTGNSVHIQGTW